MSKLHLRNLRFTLPSWFISEENQQAKQVQTSIDFLVSASRWHNSSDQYKINWNLLLTLKPKDGNLDVNIS